MPVVEQVQETVKGGSARSTALAAAAAVAAGGAATYAVRRAMSHDGSQKARGRPSSNGLRRSRASAILASAASTTWEAAADVLIPMAEEAAESAGKYLAEHSPEVIRERIAPKFIEAFNHAKSTGR
jgi:hypothetical protein